MHSLNLLFMLSAFVVAVHGLQPSCTNFNLLTTTGNFTLGYAEITLLTPDHTYTINKYNPTPILAHEFQLDSKGRLFRHVNGSVKMASYSKLPSALQFRYTKPAGVVFPRWKTTKRGLLVPQVGRPRNRRTLSLFACGIVQLEKQKARRQLIPPIEPVVSIAHAVPTSASCYSISLHPKCPPTALPVP